MKGSASILGSLIYISAATSRCIQRADDDGNLLSQCGNPIIPSFVLTIFLFWTWLLTVLVPPLRHQLKSDVGRHRSPLSPRELGGAGLNLRRHVFERLDHVRTAQRGWREDKLIHLVRYDGLRRRNVSASFQRSVRRDVREEGPGQEVEHQLQVRSSEEQKTRVCARSPDAIEGALLDPRLAKQTFVRKVAATSSTTTSNASLFAGLAQTWAPRRTKKGWSRVLGTSPSPSYSRVSRVMRLGCIYKIE